MIIVTCPSCGGRFGGDAPWQKSSVTMGDGRVEFTCETCIGRGRVERLADGTTRPIPDVMDQVQASRNVYYRSHPELFDPSRKKRK